jgi:streptogramin lyase
MRVEGEGIRRLAGRWGSAARIGSAAAGCTLLALLLGACRAAPPHAPGPVVYSAPAPSTAERYCAWFGSARRGVLYFGMAPFWSALRAAAGDPRADLAVPGPQLVGRFDLERERFLPPLDVAVPGARGGVWDVLAHSNGRVYFTTYFGPAGSVDPATGDLRHYPGAGFGLNELAPGPDGTVLATRYALGDAGGAVVVLGPDGAVRAEHPLRGPPGLVVAPKSLAFDPRREEIWVNTDLLPAPGAAAAVGHDARVLAPDGRELRRFRTPELQFVAFSEDGTGWFAERDGPSLWLSVRPPDEGPERRVPLDDAFPVGFDFVQEVRPAPDGSALVTRWSGRIHRVERDGRTQTLSLPRADASGLYYTAVETDGRTCATLCADVSVVCADLP